MEKQISIIIPTYNMETYIGKCLDSLLIPEFDQIEVWVVNDGSKDSSSEIAHSYADRYPNSINVLDKPNGNYGSCINAALTLCTGRYIKILDADDTFDTDAFSQFVKKLSKCTEDIILTNYVEVDLDDNIIKVCKNEYGLRHNVTLSMCELTKKLKKNFIQMHRLAYSNNVFKRFHYHQSEGISYTDTQWSIIPLAYCLTLKQLDISVYRYLVGREGQTMDSVQLSRSINQLFKMMTDLTNVYQSCVLPIECKELPRALIKDRHSFIYKTVLRNPLAENMDALKAYDLHLQKIAPELYDDINSIYYAPEIQYPVFKHLRKKGYPIHMYLPLIYRIELSLKVRIKRMFAR